MAISKDEKFHAYKIECGRNARCDDEGNEQGVIQGDSRAAKPFNAQVIDRYIGN